MPSSKRPKSKASGSDTANRLRNSTARKMFAATMPTKNAATHSMVSMQRSMKLRGTLSPVGLRRGPALALALVLADTAGGCPAAILDLSIGRVVLGEGVPQFL